MTDMAIQRLLIVGDEQKVTECLKEFFSAKGFEASCASTGEEALERLIECPDVVLLDIHLPDLSGMEILKRAKELCPRARVIMVTAMDDELCEDKAKSYGARGYIRKPFDFSDLTWAPVFAS